MRIRASLMGGKGELDEAEDKDAAGSDASE